jgi:O-acetyl-ADP-ribose deacetylase (regulator of RNase III)
MGLCFYSEIIMANFEYVKGNLIDAYLNGQVQIIGHCTNCQNTFGSGIAKEIRERLPEVYTADTLHYYNLNKQNLLGTISRFKGVFNLYGQDLYGTQRRQLNYGAFASALTKMVYEIFKTHDLAKLNGYNPIIGFPYKVGSDRAGGDWEIVKELIEFAFKDYKWEVKFYHLGNL